MRNNTLSIALNRKDNIHFTASLGNDDESILITRYGNNGSCPAAVFIDCDKYVSSTVKTGMKQFTLYSRQPSSRYECELPPELKEHFESKMVVRSRTRFGNTFAVHLAMPDHENDVFKRFIITIDDGKSEKVVAYITVEEDNEANVVVYGYPAGYEVET